MGENGIDVSHHNGVVGPGSNGEMLNGAINGDQRSHSSKHKHKDKGQEKDRRKESEEERCIRKEKERKEREDRYKKEGKRMETEDERRIRKEKERKEREERHKKEGRREETEEERAIRKDKERKEREERHKKEGRREETEEERKIRKEKAQKEREERYKEGQREETEEERRIRKEKERRDKEGKHRSRDKDTHQRNHKETDDERKVRKERERRERKEKEAAEQAAKIKQEQEDIGIKEEVEDSQNSDTQRSADEEDVDNYMECDTKEEPHDSKDEALLANKKAAKIINNKKRKNYAEEEDHDDYLPKKKKKNKIKQEPEDDYKPVKVKKEKGKPQKPVKTAVKQEIKGGKKVKQEIKGGKKAVKKEEPQVWKWWEEEKKKDDGKKWHFLQHRGPLFAPDYELLPSHVRFYYDQKVMRLSPAAEEIATFYGRMLDHDYTTREVFNKNFFKDWRKAMTDEERHKIRDLSKCDFTEIDAHFKSMSEQRKNRPKEEKKAEKERNEAIVSEYGICIIDGHDEKIGNFRVEPPGLFRGRGDHPKQGSLKRRTMPEDVIVNCSADSDWPEPPEGHQWKKVQHDNTVTWLASWTENVQNQIKYVMLNPSSKLKGEKDMMKYEKARQLKLKIDKIRSNYNVDLKSKEMRIRQRAVALYFIDKLALRAGNEKDEDQADTVGCCSLRVEHITLHQEHNDQENVVEFDFLGKDSIRYTNSVAVEKRVFKNVQLFMDNKKPGDDLFDRLNTTILNEYLQGLMPGLTAKVFRTYNASITLQEQLAELTNENANLVAKVLSYNRANRAVAVLCNHQRAIPKTHDKSMENLQEKITKKREAVTKAEADYKAAQKAAKKSKTPSGKAEAEKKKKALERTMEQLNKLETQQVDKDENKTIALGTSKLNYLDPRISVAWCKKFDVPIEKVYNKTQKEKFRWAIDMAGEDYVF